MRIEADPSGGDAEPVPSPSSPRAPARTEPDPDPEGLLELEPEPALEPEPEPEPDPEPEPEPEPDDDPDSDPDPEPEPNEPAELETEADPSPAKPPGATVVGPDISVSSVAVDELLSYLDGAPIEETAVGPSKTTNGAITRCASCGDIPTPGDSFCGHCGARIPP